MRDRRYTPLRGKILKTQGPSRLADLGGRRAAGSEIRHYPTGKVPKQRFSIGDRFEFEGSQWKIIYMYRLREHP